MKRSPMEAIVAKRVFVMLLPVESSSFTVYDHLNVSSFSAMTSIAYGGVFTVRRYPVRTMQFDCDRQQQQLNHSKQADHMKLLFFARL